MAVTVDDVKKIYPESGTADLSGYLRTAQLVVDTYLSGKGLSQPILDEITIYLTAHYATIGLDGGGLKRERIGNSDQSFKTPGDYDKGLLATLYGQQAVLLDSSGTLASIGAKANTLPGQFRVISSCQGSEA